MPVEIVIEAGGDHQFDLDHVRREGATELVRLLLHEAGYHDHKWRMRVEKKFSCGAETRPVAVVNHKSWCCQLKIKPGDNNSGHYCSLIMPAGVRAQRVFEALKQVEGRIGRNWRHGLKDLPAAVPSPAPSEAEEPALVPAGAVESPEEEEAGFQGSKLREWRSDPEKIQLLLLGIDEVDQAGPWSSKKEFVQALIARMAWTDVTRPEVAGLFRSLMRRRLISAVQHGSRDLGYKLTEAGQLQAQTGVTAEAEPVAVAPRAPAPAADVFQLMREYSALAQQFTDVSQQLTVNRARREELAAEIELLDAEAQELTQLLVNPEMQALMERQLQLSRNMRLPARDKTGQEGQK